MKQIYVIAMLVAALSLLVACDGDEPGNNVKPTLYNLVTFDGNGEEGAMFTLLRQSGQPAVSYVARGSRLDEKKYKPGTRVLIGYKTPSGSMDESGYITLTEYGMVNNDYLRMAPMDSISKWNAEPIYLNSIWRTGDFLNIYCRVSDSDEPRLLMMVMDEATAGNSVPKLYLVHNLLGEPQSYTRRAYMSIDISSVWESPSCSGLEVQIPDENRPGTSYKFMKDMP